MINPYELIASAIAVIFTGLIWEVARLLVADDDRPKESQVDRAVDVGDLVH